MLRSSSQHLITQSPSSTAISYTVSNALPQSTRSAQILFVLGSILRVLLFVFVLAVDVAKLQSIPYFQNLLLGPFKLQNFHTGLWASNVAALVDWRLMATGSVFVLYFCLRKGYTGANANPQTDPACKIDSWLEETLLVLQGLGVQTSTSSSTYLSTSTTRFIPTSQIQDIVIHEAFKGLEVRFYLAIIVEGATEVVVVFPVRRYPLIRSDRQLT